MLMKRQAAVARLDTLISDMAKMQDEMLDMLLEIETIRDAVCDDRIEGEAIKESPADLLKKTKKRRGNLEKSRTNKR